MKILGNEFKRKPIKQHKDLLNNPVYKSKVIIKTKKKLIEEILIKELSEELKELNE